MSQRNEAIGPPRPKLNYSSQYNAFIETLQRPLAQQQLKAVRSQLRTIFVDGPSSSIIEEKESLLSVGFVHDLLLSLDAVCEAISGDFEALAAFCLSDDLPHCDNVLSNDGKRNTNFNNFVRIFTFSLFCSVKHSVNENYGSLEEHMLELEENFVKELTSAVQTVFELELSNPKKVTIGRGDSVVHDHLQPVSASSPSIEQNAVNVELFEEGKCKPILVREILQTEGQSISASLLGETLPCRGSASQPEDLPETPGKGLETRTSAAGSPSSTYDTPRSQFTISSSNPQLRSPLASTPQRLTWFTPRQKLARPFTDTHKVQKNLQNLLTSSEESLLVEEPQPMKFVAPMSPELNTPREESYEDMKRVVRTDGKILDSSNSSNATTCGVVEESGGARENKGIRNEAGEGAGNAAKEEKEKNVNEERRIEEKSGEVDAELPKLVTVLQDGYSGVQSGDADALIDYLGSSAGIVKTPESVLGFDADHLDFSDGLVGPSHSQSCVIEKLGNQSETSTNNTARVERSTSQSITKGEENNSTLPNTLDGSQYASSVQLTKSVKTCSSLDSPICLEETSDAKSETSALRTEASEQETTRNENQSPSSLFQSPELREPSRVENRYATTDPSSSRRLSFSNSDDGGESSDDSSCYENEAGLPHPNPAELESFAKLVDEPVEIELQQRQSGEHLAFHPLPCNVVLNGTTPASSSRTVIDIEESPGCVNDSLNSPESNPNTIVALPCETKKIFLGRFPGRIKSEASIDEISFDAFGEYEQTELLYASGNSSESSELSMQTRDTLSRMALSLIAEGTFGAAMSSSPVMDENVVPDLENQTSSKSDNENYGFDHGQDDDLLPDALPTSKYEAAMSENLIDEWQYIVIESQTKSPVQKEVSPTTFENWNYRDERADASTASREVEYMGPCSGDFSVDVSQPRTRSMVGDGTAGLGIEWKETESYIGDRRSTTLQGPQEHPFIISHATDALAAVKCEATITENPAGDRQYYGIESWTRTPVQKEVSSTNFENWNHRGERAEISAASQEVVYKGPCPGDFFVDISQPRTCSTVGDAAVSADVKCKESGSLIGDKLHSITLQMPEEQNESIRPGIAAVTPENFNIVRKQMDPLPSLLLFADSPIGSICTKESSEPRRRSQVDKSALGKETEESLKDTSSETQKISNKAQMKRRRRRVSDCSSHFRESETVAVLKESLELCRILREELHFRRDRRRESHTIRGILELVCILIAIGVFALIAVEWRIRSVTFSDVLV